MDAIYRPLMREAMKSTDFSHVQCVIGVGFSGANSELSRQAAGSIFDS